MRQTAAVYHASPIDIVPSDGVLHADGLTRWATALASVVHAQHDPKTLRNWSRLRGVAPETLRSWCRTIHISPKRSLDLARVLRAVFLSGRSGWTPQRFLDVADHRTLERLMVAGGLLGGAEVPAFDEVLIRQSLVRDPVALCELRRVLEEFEISETGVRKNRNARNSPDCASGEPNRTRSGVASSIMPPPGGVR